MQCSMTLEDLVQKIVDKEKEEMLRSVPSDDEMTPFLPTRRNSYIKEVAIARHQSTATSFDTDHSNQQHPQHNQLQQVQREGTKLEHTGFTFDGI